MDSVRRPMRAFFFLATVLPAVLSGCTSSSPPPPFEEWGISVRLWPEGNDPVLRWNDIEERDRLVHTDRLMQQARSSPEGSVYEEIGEADWQREKAIFDQAWSQVEASTEDLPIVERDGKRFVVSYDHIVS